jgi:hypothetical protein
LNGIVVFHAPLPADLILAKLNLTKITSKEALTRALDKVFLRPHFARAAMVAGAEFINPVRILALAEGSSAASTVAVRDVPASQADAVANDKAKIVQKAIQEVLAR